MSVQKMQKDLTSSKVGRQYRNKLEAADRIRASSEILHVKYQKSTANESEK